MKHGPLDGPAKRGVSPVIMGEASERMLFIGVSTEGSSIMKLFPVWADVLRIDATLEGRDLPIGGEPQVYRDAVAEIGESDDVRGALVTTHKVDVFRHAHDLFADFDQNALLCREVSSISKRGGALIGRATDPITAGLAITRIFDDTGPRTVLCLGAGGAGTAISVYLLRRPSPPDRLVIVDRSAERIEDLKKVHGELGATSRVEYVVNEDPARNDALLGSMEMGTFVVNATGMGKDTPGSPITARASWPFRAVVWELNYRGELDFLADARAHAGDRHLDLHDGWDYFLYGWSEVIAEVFNLQIGPRRFEELKRTADAIRP
jgi:shikimate dehydrogenase